MSSMNKHPCLVCLHEFMQKIATKEDSSVCFLEVFCTVAKYFIACFPGYAMKELFPERIQFLFGPYFTNIYVHKQTDMKNNGSSCTTLTHRHSSCQHTVFCMAGNSC